MTRLWLMLTLLLLCGQATAALALEIRFRPQAQAQGEILLLGEVAQILPDTNENRLLGDLTLFRAPAPGEEELHQAADIRAYVQRTNPDLAEAAWGGAEEVRVIRAGITVDQARIDRILQDYLKAQQDNLTSTTTSLEIVGRIAPFVLPQGKLQVDVIPSDPAIVNSNRFTLIFRIDGRVVKNLSVRVQMQAMAQLVVATTELRRGQIIGQGDLQLVEAEMARLREPCQDLDELIGKKVRRTIRAGEPIECYSIEFPPMVQRGELVTIVAAKGSLTISARGLAREDGKKGDVIKVRNTSSQKDVHCRVIAPGVVEVEF